MVSQPDANAALADATGIVGCTVDGVNYPNVFVRQVVLVLFLAEKAAIGQKLLETDAQELLNGHVGRGDDVGYSLFLCHLEVVCEHEA